jgi:hypothetical protein
MGEKKKETEATDVSWNETGAATYHDPFLHPNPKNRHLFDANVRSRDKLQETQKNRLGMTSPSHPPSKIFSVAPN